MIKLLAFICFVMSGGIAGASISDKLRRRKEMCNDLQSILTQISVMIRYQALTVYEIANELHKNESFKNIKFLQELPAEYKPDVNFHEEWRKAVCNDSDMPEEEKNVMIDFGNFFGTSDIEGQLTSIDSSLERLHEIQKVRCEDYKRKGKLYRSIGMLFGVMAGIIVI